MLQMLKIPRTILRQAGLLGSIVLLVGCGGPSLLSHGIGDTAYEDVKTVTRKTRTDEYYSTMCRRTNICPTGQQDTLPVDFWKEMTLISLGDVDERCDYYLHALDDARRDRLVWNRGWKDIGGPVKDIFAVTNPGVKAIDIVAAAFELAQSSGDEYFSAIILNEEPSLIRRIVQKLQADYRTELVERFVGYDIDRGGWHYAVRGYLRLCLPVTIESELQSIKTNVKYERGQRIVIERETAVLKVLDGLPRQVAGRR